MMPESKILDMSGMKQPTERIICGDSIEKLKALPDESIDFCYIDPPAFTDRTFQTIWNDGEETRSFGDRWITENPDGSGKAFKDINKYKTWISDIVTQIYRVLKRSGGFCIHCDWWADFQIRIECEKIFNHDPLNVITWKRTDRIKGTSSCLSRNTDTIFIYAKSDAFSMRIPRVPLTDLQKERDYANIEPETGRRFSTNGLVKAGNEPKQLIINETTYIAPPGKRFSWNQETLDKKLQENPRILYWSRDGKYPRYKKYADEHKGVPITCLWTDIPEISTISPERIGYPTQKPIKLIARLIYMCSHKYDVILDACGGGGTTAEAAKRMNRQFIIVDVSPTACRLIANRLGMPASTIEGLPCTEDEISTMEPFEWQNWVNREIGAKNMGHDKNGIDGWLGDVPVQTKQMRSVERGLLDAFSTAVRRKGKKNGIFVGITFSSGFIKEIYRLANEEHVRILPITAKDIIEKRARTMIRKAGMSPKDVLYA